MTALTALFRQGYIFLNMMLIIISAAACFYSAAVVPVFYLLTTNLYDIFGYYFTLVRKEPKLPGKEIVFSYRIAQLMFDIVLALLLGVSFGIVPASAGVILKMFGLQDLLYYFFLKKPLPLTWNWLTFTPFGIIKKTLSKKEVIFQAVLGVMLVSFLLFQFSR